jgi:hypothetical protein
MYVSMCAVYVCVHACVLCVVCCAVCVRVKVCILRCTQLCAPKHSLILQNVIHIHATALHTKYVRVYLSNRYTYRHTCTKHTRTHTHTLTHTCVIQVMDGSLYVSDDLAPPPAFQTPPDVVSSHEPVHLADANVNQATSTQDASAQIYSQIEQGMVVCAPCIHGCVYACMFMCVCTTQTHT